MSTKRVNVQLPEELVTQVEVVAKTTHKSRTEILVQALHRYLKEVKSEESFRESVVELFLSDQIRFEELVDIIGQQDAEAVRNSMQVLDRGEGLADKLTES